MTPSTTMGLQNHSRCFSFGFGTSQRFLAREVIDIRHQQVHQQQRKADTFGHVAVEPDDAGDDAHAYAVNDTAREGERLVT